MYNPYLPQHRPVSEPSADSKEKAADFSALLKRLKPESLDSGDLLLLLILLLLLLDEEHSDPELLLTLGLTLLQ